MAGLAFCFWATFFSAALMALGLPGIGFLVCLAWQKRHLP